MPRISLDFVNPCATMAVFKVQSLIIIIVCFHSRSSYGFKLPYNGVEIVTYGEPCHPPRHLPVTIEEPAKLEQTESVLSKLCTATYQPLKLNYRVVSTEPNFSYQPRAEYPIAVQVPQVPPRSSSEIIATPDPLRGKSYTYNIQTLPPPSIPISRRYDFDFQIPPPPASQSSAVSTSRSIKLLAGLTSKIDRILIPACQVSSSGCCKTDTA